MYFYKKPFAFYCFWNIITTITTNIVTMEAVLLRVRHSLWVRPEKAVLLAAAELLAAEPEPPPPRGMLSNEGNWKGSDTGTIPPSMP